MGGPVRKKRNFGYPKVSWTRWIILLSVIFMVVFHTSSVNCSSSSSASVVPAPAGKLLDLKRKSEDYNNNLPQLQFDNFEQLVGDGFGSSEFTVITPFPEGERIVHDQGGNSNDNNNNVGKQQHTRVVRRRRRKKVSSSSGTTPSPTVVTSVTMHPFGENNVRETVASFPIYEAPPKRRVKKKGGHHNHHHHAHKVPEVWKVQNFNLHDDGDDGISHDLKHSILDKRESSEKQSSSSSPPNKQHINYTSLFDTSRETTTTRDLNYDESINTHPFFNSSTPISNELQNSLQFTLQFLHPLLNSDVDLSENSQKHPENKTVALTHSLSDSVAQTPVDSDLGFLPAHLKKKHPLLNQDSFISGEGGTGASKTGVRTNFDIIQLNKAKVTPTPIPTTSSTLSVESSTPQPTLDTMIFPTYIPTSNIPVESSEGTSTPSSEILTTTTINPTTTSKAPSSSSVRTSTTRKTPTFIRRHTTTTTTTAQPVTTTTVTPTTISTTKATTPVSSTIRTTLPTTTKTSTTTKIPIDLDHILGILNITELQSGISSSSETTGSFSSSSKERDQLNESLQHPPVIMFPLDKENNNKASSSTTNKPAAPTITSSPTTLKPTSPTESPVTQTISSSAEVSSAEQLFVEQLLGIASNSQSRETGGGGGKNPATSNGQSDSGEQLLQLFGSLLQGQGQGNQGKPNNQQNPFHGLGGLGGKSQNNPNNANDAQTTNALLQSLILSSLSKSQQSNNNNQPNFAPNLFNLESLLLTPSSSPTGNPPPKTSSSKPLPPPTSSTKVELTTTPKLKAETGLSDSDLKSIFQLLDSQTLNPTTTRVPSTTTTHKTTTTIITTTPRPTTTPSPPRSSTHTTTLHPALQSMLDLFTNQLKPFQSIPSSTPTFLQTLSKPTVAAPTQAPITTTTTKAPPSFSSTTLNSIDLLTQLLSLGGGGTGGGLSKINPVRATPAPSSSDFSLASIFGGGRNQKTPQNPEFSLASIFGNLGGQPKAATNNNLFSSPQLPVPKKAPSNIQHHHETSAPSESNQLLNFFGSQQTTPPPPSGIYYWLDMNAFLGGDPKADGMAGIRPKIGNRYPFIKVH